MINSRAHLQSRSLLWSWFLCSRARFSLTVWPLVARLGACSSFPARHLTGSRASGWGRGRVGIRGVVGRGGTGGREVGGRRGRRRAFGTLDVRSIVLIGVGFAAGSAVGELAQGLWGKLQDHDQGVLGDSSPASATTGGFGSAGGHLEACRRSDGEGTEMDGGDEVGAQFKSGDRDVGAATGRWRVRWGWGWNSM